MTPQQIKEWRISKGLTQSELADKCGVGKSSVSQWESGATKPSGSSKAILEDYISGRRALIPLTALEERLLAELVRVTGVKDRSEALEKALLGEIRKQETAGE